MAENNILVYCEPGKDGIAEISTEALGIGRKLADELGSQLIGVAIGQDAAGIAADAVRYGADYIYTADAETLADYQTETYTTALAGVIKSQSASIVIMGQTGIGRDLAPSLAAAMDGAATMDCVELAIDPDTQRLLMTKPVYGGNAWAVFTTECDPQVVTVRAKAMEAAEPNEDRQGEIMTLDVTIDPEAVRARLVEKVPEVVEGIRLEDARVVIGGGRGVGGEDAFAKLGEIATMLKGTVGASRAACDNGWIPATKQIGLTGKVVTPELYFAVGVSGASQHMAGCHGSTHLIAINNDDGAHIFNEAHYGVLGDWEPVMDGFVNKLRELGVS